MGVEEGFEAAGLVVEDEEGEEGGGREAAEERRRRRESRRAASKCLGVLVSCECGWEGGISPCSFASVLRSHASPDEMADQRCQL